MKAFVIALALAAAVIAGCTTSQELQSSPTPVPSTEYRDSPPTPVISPDTPLPQAVGEMKRFMEEKPEDMAAPTEEVREDKAFAGNVEKKGEFRNLNYMTAGTASIESVGGSNYVVFGEDFSTPNGPDIVVYLTRNTAPTTREDIKAGVELSELKSTKGKQVYEIPREVDVAGIRSITLHCRAFNVPWSYAPLSEQ